MIKKVICSLMAFVSVLTVSAQITDTTSVKPITLEQAHQICLQHNRSLQSASLDVKMAEAAKWQTIATMLPQVDMNLSYSNYCGYQLNFGGMSIPMNPDGTMAVTAAIALSGQQIVGALVQNIVLDMQNINAKQNEQNTLSNVTSTYISILTMQKTLELLRQNLANINELKGFTDEAVRVGVSEQTEADKLVVQVASMNSSINQIERSLELLYNSFGLLMGTGISVRYEPTQSIEELVNSEKILALLKCDLDLSQNYSYQLLEQNTKLAKNQMTLKAMEYVPTVSAYYQYSAKTYFGESEGMNMTPPNLVGVSVKVPIWSSGNRAAGVHEKKLAYQQAVINAEDARDGLLVQDRQLRFNLSSAFENYMIQEQNIEVSTRVFQSVSNKFSHGYASSLEVTTASTELISAQNNYIQALLEVVNAQLELRKLLNKFD